MNLIRVAFIFVFVMLLSSLANAFKEKSKVIFYDELPSWIKRNNHSVRSARLMVEASERRTGHLMRSYLPRVRVFLGYENYRTGTLEAEFQPYGGLEASLNLFNFGKDRLEENIRRADHKRVQMASRLDFNSKLFEARRIFWKIVYHNEVIELLKKAEKKNRRILTSVSQRIQKGLTTETDSLEFEMYTEDLITGIESFQHENKILMIALGKYLGTDVRSKGVDIKFIPHEHDEALIEGDFDKTANTDLQYARFKSEILKLKAFKRSKWWTPSFDVYGGYSLYTKRDRVFNSHFDRDDIYIGIRLTMTVFDGLRESSEVSSQNAKSAAAAVNLRYREEELSSQFEMIKEEMKHAHELIHVSEGKIKLGEVYFSRILKEYEKGNKSSLDVLNSLQRIVSFKTEYASARLDYQNKKIALLKMKGRR